MIEPWIWAGSLAVVVLSSVVMARTENGKSTLQLIAGVFSLVFIVMTLIGLWQAWSPWEIVSR